ncbi:MAG: DinB family protein [Chryseolinea sp.]
MVTATHKRELRSALTKAFNDFSSALSSFDDANVNEIPFAGSWTPAQVSVHIIMATDGVPDGNTSPAHRPYDANLPRIKPWWEDLNQKFTSPEPLRPDDQPRSKKILLEELQRVHTKDLIIIDKTDLSAVCLDFELPSIGYLTRFEWLWFMEMHLKRHHFQLSNMLKTFADQQARLSAK